ncbi:FG-GAP repeat domain-containing protein [Microbulbifer sp. TYP-18]|uniref:FG-GAP repeat domain-containing protein n=1 Tax=Microbulbifer sp. TYP-18 TaxID=3230024 RepID=UPI0034C6922F
MKPAQYSILTFCLLFLSKAALSQPLIYTDEFNLDQKGGGEYYENWVEPGQANYLVSTREELVDALSQATFGQIIYVDDDAEINLGTYAFLQIPDGVTLASGRGREGSSGALLFTEAWGNSRLIFELHDRSNIRITGLRFKGPYFAADTSRCDGEEVDAVNIRSSQAIEIDNNEFFGWPRAAINIINSQSIEVHHNALHHNRRNVSAGQCQDGQLGQAVATNLSKDLNIEHNIFQYNGQDIVSREEPWEAPADYSYRFTAAYNLVLGGNIGENFVFYRRSPHNFNFYITHSFEIHHNAFFKPSGAGIRLDLQPVLFARVYDNVFSHSNQGSAVELLYGSESIYVFDNHYGEPKPNDWKISLSGNQGWQYRRFTSHDFDSVAWGDFDGDGATDAFLADGKHWYLSSKAKKSWKKINTSAAPLKDLRFGDFNGDGKTDVFRANGKHWYVSWSGTSGWQKIGTSVVLVKDLYVGDFNGDGIDDLLTDVVNSGAWSVSWSGRSGWDLVLSRPATRLSETRFADLDGNGITEVYWAEGTRLRQAISRDKGGFFRFINTGTWEYFSGGISIEELRFADFDGDGKDDFFRVKNSKWYVGLSRGFEKTEWRGVNRSSIHIEDLAVHDFTGNGKADVMSH